MWGVVGVIRVVAAALERFGHLDILANNGGRGMRIVVDINVNCPFLMARAATPHMMRARWGRIVNTSMNRSAMRRAGFSPYGPSKAALECETVIWAQDLQGTGVTVNALLPGGATLTGMILSAFPESPRSRLLDPAIMVPPLLWLVSSAADAISGCRVIGNRWDDGNPLVATENAGWGDEATRQRTT
ncbi:MAG: SDR family NAD(P)-dependent oxidoreductase [Pseudomonadota bacterium]|jgi:3-oxoacyl-[acyl-carrier protein] reductase|nr:SDR family NAD(P)-dependent oxidoreductase [Pseudomonadota bacterium]